MTPPSPPRILVAPDENTHGERVMAEHFLPNVLRFPLSSADYAWDGLNDSGGAVLCGLERKRTTDLARCVAQSSHHLVQLRQMAEDYHVRYLVWEGGAREGDDGQLEVPAWNPATRVREWQPVSPRLAYSRLDKHLMTVRMWLGVIVWRTYSYRETCRVIQDWAEWWQTPPPAHTSAAAFPQPFSPGNGLGPIGLVPRLAKELDGIGWVRAGAVGQRFQHPHDMDAASPEEWLKTVGIGLPTLGKVLRQWHGEERAEEMLVEYQHRLEEAKTWRKKGSPR